MDHLETGKIYMAFILEVFEKTQCGSDNSEKKTPKTQKPPTQSAAGFCGELTEDLPDQGQRSESRRRAARCVFKNDWVKRTTADRLIQAR